MNTENDTTLRTYARGSSEKLSPNFRVREFQCPCGCSGSFPIDGKLVEYLQNIRDYFGVPVHISSAYRCESYNTKADGSDSSRHKTGMAADIWVEGYLKDPRTVAQYAESIGILGIGLYEGSRDMWFVHIDTRTQRSFWEGHGNTPVSGFGGKEVVLSLRVLKKGSKGEDVKALQSLLNAQGYALETDGSFGAATGKAVKGYQAACGLTADGSCGKATWSQLLGRA